MRAKASAAADILVGAQRALVVYSDKAFDFVGVSGSDRAQDLPMLFLGDRQMTHKNFFQKMAVQPIPMFQNLGDEAGHQVGAGTCTDQLMKMTILPGLSLGIRNENIHVRNNRLQFFRFQLSGRGRSSQSHEIRNSGYPPVRFPFPAPAKQAGLQLPGPAILGTL